MTTYNTGNPIGSTDARDRLDNSENMDILENSTTLNAHPDRLGTMRKTRKGMELEHDNQIYAHESEHDSQIAAHEVEHDNQMQSFENDFDNRLAGMAFTRVGTFTAGATLTDMRQTLLWEVSQGGDGREYGWTGSFLPAGKVVSAESYPTPISAGNWVDRTEDRLRSDLLANLLTTRENKLSLKYHIHAADYGVIDDYYIITPTILAELIGGVTGYSYAVGINPNPTDNADKIQKALNDLAPGGVLSFAGMRGVGISRTLIALTPQITVSSDNKFLSHILPITGFTGTCLVQFGDGTQAYQRTHGIGYIASVDAGNDVSGIEVDNFYNFEAVDIKAQSGNFITRECAGIDVINGRHTLIEGSNLHNSLCYGMIIRAHLTGLKIYNNAFDESDISIISKGNIVEMITKGNEFGSARPNPTHPAPFGGVHIDLRIGSHGSIKVDDLFSGGGGTNYHLRWGFVSRMEIDGVFTNAARFAIAGNKDTARALSINGVFGGNGTSRTSTDPSTGTTDPDVSPFCSDIHLAKSSGYPTVLSGSSNSTVASAWIEGGGSALSASNITVSELSNQSTVIAYAHSTSITPAIDLVRGTIVYRHIAAIPVTITGRTVTRGVAQFGSVSVAGAALGDTVSVVFKDAPASYNLVLTGMVISNNLVRWILVNTSDTAVVIPDTLVSVSVVKAK